MNLYFRFPVKIGIGLLVVVCFTVSHYEPTLSQPDYQLVAILADEAGNAYFAHVGVHDVEIFTEIERPFGFPFVSPDKSLVAFSTYDEGILVLDDSGSPVVTYDLGDQLTEQDWLSVWGWSDNQTLVLSISYAETAAMRFFQFDLSQMLPALEVMEYFPVFPENLQTIDLMDGAVPDWFYRFSPTFDHMVSPIRLDESMSSFRDDYAYVYDLEAQDQMPVPLTSMLPWYYYPFTSQSLSWANRLPAFAFAAFDEQSCNPDLYVLTLPGTIEPLATVDCTKPAVLPIFVSWSPDDTRIAYWITLCFHSMTRIRLHSCW